MSYGVAMLLLLPLAVADGDAENTSDSAAELLHAISKKEILKYAIEFYSANDLS